ncbi:MAG TPA: hypothetical protein VH082_10800 [Rudaea sp.]|jgi:hypothetical protein|nr:hypothetical protein [Rudaea sp.]
MSETAVAPADTEAERAKAVSVEHVSVLDTIAPHIFQTLSREPALAITLGYLFVAMAGIFYNYTFYERFGIPVLMLSQVGDFLVAGIQQPMAILLVLSTFPLVWLVDRFNLNRRRRRVVRREAMIARGGTSLWFRFRVGLLRSPPRWFTATAFFLLIFVYGWIFVQSYAKHRAADVENGDAQMVTVWLNGQTEPLPSKSKGWTYLGAVSNYIFVYDHDGARSEILPVNNVARLEPAPVARDRSKAPIIIAPIP